MTLFFKLIIGHYFADYVFQNDFIAKAKNHKLPIPGIPWWQLLVAHAAIHAGVVWYLTGNGYCAGAEFLLHTVIDYAKCDGKITFNQDQVLHVLCKIGYAVILFDKL